jgi:L-seryl-tRNA(Ser) seleniumtransferase
VPDALPSLAELLAHPGTERLLIRFSQEGVHLGYRDILHELDRAVRHGYPLDPRSLRADAIVARLESRLAAGDDAWLQPVINATGLVLHRGLGGALLPSPAVEAVRRAATQPVTVEYNLSQGAAGVREQSVAHLLMDLAGVEAATVVNTVAGAVWLAIRVLARDREVVVARRTLHPGSSPLDVASIVAAGGARHVAAGDGTRTTANAYDAAVSPRTAMILSVDPDDTPTPDGDAGLMEIVAIGRARGIPVVEVLTAGALVDLGPYGVNRVPVVPERIALGADLIIVSGDGLVGGPESGLVVGTTSCAGAIAADSMHAAERCSKLTIAALEATLRLYRESACIAQEIPTLWAWTRPLSAVGDTAERALPALQSALGAGFRVSVQDRVSLLEEARPDLGVPTKALVVEHDFLGGFRIAGRFRQARPPIVGRVEDALFVLDARTIVDPLEMVPNWSEELGSFGP